MLQTVDMQCDTRKSIIMLHVPGQHPCPATHVGCIIYLLGFSDIESWNIMIEPVPQPVYMAQNN
jgi:hypothetical protein